MCYAVGTSSTERHSPTNSSWTDRSRTFFTQLFNDEALPVPETGWSLWRVWIPQTAIYWGNKRRHNGYLLTLRLYYKPRIIMKLFQYNQAKSFLNLSRQFPQSTNDKGIILHWMFPHCIRVRLEDHVVIFLGLNISLFFSEKIVMLLWSL